MNEILSWMIEVETKVESLYSEAAVVFSEDEDFSSFLSQLAKEEQTHINILEESMASLLSDSIGETSFVFDEEFRQKVFAPIERAQNSLNAGGLTQNEMINVIAEIEFSEWNEMFIYAIDVTKALVEDFQKAAAEIDQHRIRIQEYISGLPNNENLLQRVRKLKSLSDKRVLIVEDKVAVARMFEVLIMDDAEVILAHSCEEGISQLQKGHFDLVISDVEMPRMNGIEMYKRALVIDPTLENKFVFFSATTNPESMEFFQSSNVVFIPKPSPVKVICEAIGRVLDTARKNVTLH